MSKKDKSLSLNGKWEEISDDGSARYMDLKDGDFVFEMTFKVPEVEHFEVGELTLNTIHGEYGVGIVTEKLEDNSYYVFWSNLGCVLYHNSISAWSILKKAA